MDDKDSQFRNPEERMKMRDLLNEERERLQSQYNKSRQNAGFTQVYERGWGRLRFLIAENRSAASLYTFLAQNMDASTGALIASQAVICEATGMSRTTLWRASNFLEENGSLLRLKVDGGIYAYALNDAEVWKSWDSAKERSVFRAKTLSKRSEGAGNINRRIFVMLREAQSQQQEKK